uniref:Uncharacterized protein n=1 Tax=Anguilla anguilla TaxID=7936 RepID=A0A0E9XU09_ANGAN
MLTYSTLPRSKLI